MKNFNASAILDKWKSGMAGASKAYQDGVNAVTESPMQKAAQNLDKAVANYSARVADGTMAAKLNAVSIGTWKSQCAIGASKLSTGAQKGSAKMGRFIANAIPMWQAQRAAADAAGSDPVARFAAALQIAQAAKGNL